MSTPCEKHASLPVVGQSPCAGCEIERVRRNRDMWKGQVERQAKVIESLRAQVDTLAEWYANSLNNRESLRKAVQFSVDRFSTISSGDGSGHADLARAVMRIAGDAMSKDPLADKGQ